MTGSALPPYVEPRPAPPILSPADKRLGFRTLAVRSAMRAKNINFPMPNYEDTIAKGLRFLNSQQDPDGGWAITVMPKTLPGAQTGDYQWGRAGVTGLALLAYLGQGNTWVKGRDINVNPYADNVAMGFKFLFSQQDPATGRIGGGEGERTHFMYNHGMATLALAEAAALTGDEEVRNRAALAVGYIVKTQTRNGGWNYFGHPDSDDVSVSVWQVQALAAAREAGIAVPAETFARAQSMFTKATVGERVMYRLQNDDNIYTPSLCGMGLMIRQLCGESNASPDLQAVANKLAQYKFKFDPNWSFARGWSPVSRDVLARAKVDPYELYFCTYGLYFMGGANWATWQQNMLRFVSDMQEIDGSFRCNDVNTLKAGTSYATALCLLTLECPYRIEHSVPKE
jgi:hypothetical protein